MDKNKQLDQLFQTAKEQPVMYSFDAAKEQFVHTLSVSGGSGGFKKMKLSVTKKWIIMLGSITIIATVMFVVSGLFSKEEVSHSKAMDLVQKEKDSREQKKEVFLGDFNSTVKVKKEKSSKVTNQKGDRVEYVRKNDPVSEREGSFSKVEPAAKNNSWTEEYVFPKLTKEEIAANHKQKKQMLKALEKFDKKVYSYIPSGTFEFEGEMVSVQGFYMQKTEATNLEYRTFLFDLLIQDRKDEFLKAKPDQALWTALFDGKNSTLEEKYFSDVAYNDFPVVNVSREGAELYCKWLSQEINKFVDEKKKSQFNDLRIPSRTEWVMAASAEGKQLPYPWTGPFLRDSKGCYLANFKPTDSTYIEDGGFIPVKVNSYTANAIGLYGMSGNAAEMVYDNYPSKNPGTAGGGWMSSAEEIKILGPDPHQGLLEAHPNVGFRVVMTYRNP